MRPIITFACAGLLSLSSTASHAYDFLNEQHQGDVSFITGGITLDERSELEARANAYSVKLVFALNSGGYLSDTDVTIRSADGKDVLKAKADGPFFYADLTPGKYVAEASDRGRTKTQSFTVSNKATPKVVRFYWPEISSRS